MRRILAKRPLRFICAVLLVVLSAAASGKNSITIGGVTFDFDAPSKPLTVQQQAFFQRYKNAVNAHDAGALLALQDPSASGCKFDGSQILLRGLKETIPDGATVRFFPSVVDFAKVFGLGDVAYMPVAPTAVLGISYRKDSKDHVKISQIMQPVREDGDAVSLVPYCLTEKGKSMLDQKKGQP